MVANQDHVTGARPPAAGVAAGVGVAVAVGWAVVGLVFAGSAVTADDLGGATAAGILAAGTAAIAVLTARGARDTWRGIPTRRLATGALCTLVVAGWPAIGALSQGVTRVLEPVGLAACALTAAAGAILVLLHRAAQR